MISLPGLARITLPGYESSFLRTSPFCLRLLGCALLHPLASSGAGGIPPPLGPVRVGLEPLWHRRLRGEPGYSRGRLRMVLAGRVDRERPCRRLPGAPSRPEDVRRSPKGAPEPATDVGADGSLHHL